MSEQDSSTQTHGIGEVEYRSDYRTHVHYEIGEDGQVISKTITTHDGTDGEQL